MDDQALSPDDARWEDRTISLVSANLYALAGLIPIFALVVLPFWYLVGIEALGEGAQWVADHLLLVIGAFIVSIFVHEGLHALGWLVFARVPREAISFGVKMGTPYTHADVPMAAGGYRLGAALPGLVLGVLPVVISWLWGNGALLLYGALMLFTAMGDALVLWLLRDLPSDVLVRDHPSEAGCQVMLKPK